MAFDIEAVGGYGTGALGDSDDTLNAASLNSYARVTAISASTITINSSAAVLGAYEKFTVGSEILFHVSASTASTYTKYLGAWCVAKITAVNNNVLTLDTDVTKTIPTSEFARYYVQAVTIAQWQTLTLNTGIQITPMIYSTTNYYGGITAIKCSEALVFNGGHINLAERGIPVASKGLRPNLTQETNGTKDIDQYAGWENAMGSRHFTLNAGDGAAWIVAKSVTCHADSRIGNTSTYGSQFCRGASDSVGSKPSNVTNIGGSTILLAAESITNFNVKLFAKYRSSSLTAGAGLCRCYIATNTKLKNDEGLYAYDVIGTPTRVMQSFNIKDFGDGTLGDLQNSTGQLNNYAKVTKLDTTRKKLTYSGKTTAGLAPLAVGALVMVHQNHKTNTVDDTAQSGRFILAKILADSGTVFTLNTALPAEFNVSTYAVQILSVPQCKNFTLSEANAATPKFNGTLGGILAIAVKNHCNLAGGKLNVEKKGGGTAYGANGMNYISNSGLCDRLPIGEGHGSVFILAKEITMNTSTRIGATYSGASFGGKAKKHNDLINGGGYRGDVGAVSSYDKTALEKGYSTSPGSGSGAGGGTTGSTSSLVKSAGVGGYGSNSGGGVPQGAHVLIVADTINNFCQDAVSTGGAKGDGIKTTKTGSWNRTTFVGTAGGAGYGGGGAGIGINDFNYYNAASGGYNGGGGGKGMTASNNAQTTTCGYGGGGSGWAFVYCNEAVNQDTTATVAD